MQTHNWQGFPLTEERGDTTSITLRWRSPRRIHARTSLFKFGVIVSVGLGLYGFLSGGLSRYDPLVLAAAFLVWLLVLWVGLTAMIWRKRVIKFSRQFISFQYRLDFKRLNRNLSHGFRLAPFQLLGLGQPAQQQGQPTPFVHQNFYLFLDHAEQTVLLAEISGAKIGELLLRRLVNVTEHYKQRYAHQQGMDEHRGEDAPRSTFNRRVAI